MEQMITTLKTMFFAMFGGILLFGCIVEFVLLDTTGGIMAGDKQLEFIYQTMVIMLTLGGCYVSLRLFKMKRVEAELHEAPIESYRKWSVLRLTLLEGPALLNIIGYWFFLNASFAYLCALLLLSFLFVYPTKNGFINDTGYTEE